ncbi:histidine kinase N-terminal 7TM domain-containing protein [Halorussus lipolyticus]|uniref:histidine kinase N-terminal 7TM domain-containing protein n=1 Tax=Halorussus lipolyticus TaxID=3034024 RepID=UPI0023E849DE|nr:histidine kinase N-terminal 7TM domain-containing protein [Halorussus sp. DT80]
MDISLTWLALGPFSAFVMSLYFLWHLWPYRDEPGGGLLIATVVCEGIWTGAYGFALLVFDPVVRQLLEIPIWFGKSFITVFFLAYALEYTGRAEIVRSKWMFLLGGIQLSSVMLVATNPLHQLAWSNYHIDPIFGAATVAYTHQMWLYMSMLMFYSLTTVALLLLLEAFVSYGSVYRGQTVVVALSFFAPFVANAAWLFKWVPHPGLNLTTTTLTIHLALDFYGLFHLDMFEQSPAARRVGERAAIHDLGTPVLIIDTKHRVIDVNEEAQRVFGIDAVGDIGGRLNDLVETPIDVTADEQLMTVRTDGERREYSVASSEVADSTGTHVGYTLVFQDVTEEKRREQRLEVLNRVLRHNLRNDMTTITGYAEVIQDTDDPDEIRDHTETIIETGRELAELGDKARRFERAMGESGERQRVEVGDLLADLAEEFREDYPGSRIHVDLPEGLALDTDPAVVRLVFSNLVENALRHDTHDRPRVEIGLTEVERDQNSVVFEVRDDGPGIPDHEVAVISQGEERDLEHGSGLGLWIIQWGVNVLGGDVAFDGDEDGTVVSVRLPGLVDAPSLKV